jgi:hypothetical protein
MVDYRRNREYIGVYSVEVKGYALKEVPCGVRRVDTPPIIYGNVENTECDNEEWCRPFGLEANGNHDARDEAEQR